ncbi:MAG: hypothetical protein LQ343_007889 [Gyalolechia ehrenbergii]|nr:MAG: hypothetical protein LQ343_007889 [Gyalolechia ehrenbergii]
MKLKWKGLIQGIHHQRITATDTSTSTTLAMAPITINLAELRYEVRDMMPAITTSKAIVRELIAMRAAQDDAAVIAAIDAAINEEATQHLAYRDNLRRFYEISLPVVCRAEYYRRFIDTFGSMDHAVHESLQYLMSQVDFMTVTDIGDKRQVLENLKRHWRWLGCPTAPYEPLYEFVLGVPLRNE